MEPRAEEARKLMAGNKLYAPPLVWHELTNVALVKVRRHAPDRAGILAGLALALAVDIRQVQADPLEVVDLAEKTGLSAYDAAYLWVARETGSALATFDHKLALAASRILA